MAKSSKKIGRHTQALALGDQEARFRAAKQLGEIGATVAIEDLCRALQDWESWRVRRAAAESLGKLRAIEAIDPLCQSLKDESFPKSWYVRRAAATTLGILRSAEAVDELCLALNDQSKGVQRAAVIALGKIADSRAVLPLCHLLSSRNQKLVEEVGEVLVKLGHPAVAPLCRKYQEDEKAAPNAALVLRKMVHARSPEIQWAVLGDSALSPAERWQFLEILRGYHPQWVGVFSAERRLLTNTQGFCVRGLQSPDPAVQAGAHAVLDYLSLGRASRITPARAPDQLLRAAQGNAMVDDGGALLRASGATPTPPLPERNTLRQRLQRWFRKSPL